MLQNCTLVCSTACQLKAIQMSTTMQRCSLNMGCWMHHPATVASCSSGQRYSLNRMNRSSSSGVRSSVGFIQRCSLSGFRLHDQRSSLNKSTSMHFLQHPNFKARSLCVPCNCFCHQGSRVKVACNRSHWTAQPPVLQCRVLIAHVKSACVQWWNNEISPH